MQNDLEKIFASAYETGYKTALADALKELIETLKRYEEVSMCRVCLVEAGDRIASLNDKTSNTH